MLWVYGHYKYFTLSVRESTLQHRRQNLTYTVDPRIVKAKCKIVDRHEVLAVCVCVCVCVFVSHPDQKSNLTKTSAQ